MFRKAQLQVKQEENTIRLGTDLQERYRRTSVLYSYAPSNYILESPRSIHVLEWLLEYMCLHLFYSEYTSQVQKQ